MSVIVKGMDMPESCGSCDISAKISMPSGVILRCRSGKIVRTPINDPHDVLNRRHPDCPLVVLPDKHGRLIDEDDVINAIHERLHELQTHKEFIKKRGDIDLLGILPYIAKIQTIIEAEDSE